VVDIAVLGQGFVPVLGVSPVIIIPLVLLTGISRRCHRRRGMSTIHSFGFITFLCPRSFMVIIHHSKMYRLFFFLFTPHIDNDQFIIIHQQMYNLVFTQSYCIKTLQTTICFDP
jgi:hypothetical protein